MSEYRIYHNPRCSKSRRALELLEERGVKPQIARYLDTPPSAAEIEGLIDRLGVAPHSLLRPAEAEYSEAGLTPQSSREAIVTAITRYPRLLERPIVVRGERAVLGRPPEQVLTLLEED